MVRLVIFFLVTISLVACSLAPGLHIDQDQFEESEDLQEEKLPVTLYPITPEMILSQFKSQELFENYISDGKEAVLGRQRYHYRVGPQDVLSVIVWGHPELTIPAGGNRSPEVDGHRVNADGTIFYPYVGTVFVAGKTIEEIRELLTEKLSKYIKNPQIGVTVVTFDSKKVYVMGDVIKQSAIPITNIRLSLAEILSTAGINNSSADPERIFVLRLENGKPVAFQLDASEPNALILATAFQMKPQDVVFVSSADISRWGKVLREILPSLNTIWFLNVNN